MRSILKTIIGLPLVLLSGIPLIAQSKADLKYREESEMIRKQVWSWNKPEFKSSAIPAEYANASKVIIAHHTELVADSKSKFMYYGIGFSSKKETSVLETVREMIKVNDKSAVDEYSELSFTRLKKISGFVAMASTSFVGVRVIKPNGKVTEINADDIVLTKDARNSKNAKLAISDLQPGDIIDYFIATDQQLTNELNVKNYTVPLFDESPILHYSFHGQLGRKFAIEYRSYNGAPDLKVSKNADDDIIIDVEKKNMAPLETSLWVAPAQQLPIIRMNISLGYKGMGSRYLLASKPGEVVRNKETDELMEKQAHEFAKEVYSTYVASKGAREFDEIVDDARKKAKQSGLRFNEMSDDEKAAYLYYTFRFTKLLNFNIDQLERSLNSGDYTFNGLAYILNCAFEAADLEPAILVSSPRTGYRINEVMDLEDLVTAAYLMGTKKIFSIESIYDFPYAVPASIDGIRNSSSIKLNHKRMVISLASINKLAEVGPGIAVPQSDATRNAHIEHLALALTPGQENVSVQRKTILRGHYKYSAQRRLILYEDFYESERKAFGEKKSLLETLEDGRKSRKFIDEVKNAFAEARKKQKDAFQQDAKGWFEQEVTNVKEYKVDNMGVRHTAPDFIYSSNFDIDGLVKKAGNNLIFEIGKIQGQPLTIKPDQRKRTLDVYMSYPRSVEYHLEFKIPPGYTAQGIEALNKKVVNEVGFFTVEASANADILNVKVKKHYLQAYVPAANWNKMVEFLDAADEWTNAKILLKKK